MYNQLITLALLLCTIGSTIHAQHQDVFPSDEGNILLQKLVQHYKPNSVYDYSNARDTLFAKVYAQGTSLKCVYTDYDVYLPPNQDPTTAVYMGGAPNGINTEHTYPQSKGATGNAKSDMHHLYPTRIDVNGDRGSKPFYEIPDTQTDTWYFEGQQTSGTPSSSVIDQYSELSNNYFEPREAHKGNVARAMMYFYTMYKNQADNADPNFFNIQKSTLCDWHILDPVDDAEWERTHIIASHQDGKANPFVLDCTLAARTYCPGLQCVVSTDEVDNRFFSIAQNFPNPFYDETTIGYTLEKGAYVNIYLTDALGRQQGTLVNSQQVAGQYEVTVDSLPSGVWFYHIIVSRNGEQFAEVKKMIKY